MILCLPRDPLCWPGPLGHSWGWTCLGPRGQTSENPGALSKGRYRRRIQPPELNLEKLVKGGCGHTSPRLISALFSHKLHGQENKSCDSRGVSGHSWLSAQIWTHRTHPLSSRLLAGRRRWRTQASTHKTWGTGVLGMRGSVVGVDILSHLDSSMPTLSEASLMASHSLSEIHFRILPFLPFGFCCPLSLSCYLLDSR